MVAWAGPVLDHFWQSSWCIALLALLAVVLRRHDARVRCWVWLAAAVKLLVPWAALAALGALINVWMSTDLPPARPQVAWIVDAVAQPFTQERFTVVAESPGAAAGWWSPQALAAVLFGAWAAGSLVMLGRWARRWIALHRVLRAATIVEHGREASLLRRLVPSDGGTRGIALALTDQPFGPGTAGALRPVIVWPHEMSSRMSDEEITAVLAHELCHVRRGDGITASVVRVTQALFWFCPLVWWIGRRLDVERERACDEEVLQHGGAPSVYAEALVKTCQFHLAAPLTCGAGRGGAVLKARITGILWPTARRTLSAPARAALALLAAVAIASPVVAAAVVPPAALGLGPNQFFQATRLLVAWAPRETLADAGAAERFRSLSIVRSLSTTPGGLQTFAGGRLAGSAVSARQLVRVAYGSFKEVPAYALVGLPEWAGRERFDIRARAGHEFVNDVSGEPRYLTMLLQNLLASEFGLLAHREVRTVPVYALTRTGAALGPGLRPSASTCWRAGEHPIPAIPVPPRQWCKSAFLRSGLTESASLAWVANVLSGVQSLGRPVVDHTGLAGFYDIEWTAALSGQAIATALDAQLGLRLEPRDEPLELLVVDRIQRPEQAR